MVLICSEMVHFCTNRGFLYIKKSKLTKFWFLKIGMDQQQINYIIQHILLLYECDVSKIDPTATNVHDIHYLVDLVNQLSACTLLGDKGYLSAEMQLNLFEYSNIRLDTPKKNNQKSYKPQFSLFRKSRKRIETWFS
ncbi:hypothetical protein DCO56_19920 [Sphingobacterium athyrii]|uniref:Transposase IS4-like domain-containing protein n=1 Tax=Sphingobacterium athyrii TaxID=2152717 RepID=A0A363NNX3_9SPHI|nr:hypothetical protein DCO56_19920 [Sphingobacterium athyrii]